MCVLDLEGREKCGMEGSRWDGDEMDDGGAGDSFGDLEDRQLPTAEQLPTRDPQVTIEM